MKPILIASLLLAGCPDTDPVVCDDSIPGNICTIAGNGENGYNRNADTTSLPALEARLSLPQDTVLGPDGTLFILDWNNHRVRKLTPEGRLEWVAGRGELGGSLDDPANGDFNHPTNMILNEDGTQLIIAAWHNSKIRAIDVATGMVVDNCGDGRRAYFGDGGPALTAALDLPASIALNPEGNLVIMDQANQVIRMVDDAGNIQRLAGRCIIDSPPPMGPGECAAGVEPTQCPMGMNPTPSGKYVCGDPMMYCSLPCTPSYGGDGGPAMELRMNQPFGQAAIPAGRIVYDDAGNLYFADTANHLIRRIDTAGNVTRVAGQPPMAGAPQSGYAGDGGPAIDSLLNLPVDLDIGDDGTIYFTDKDNHCVRAITPDGNIDTVVGVCGMRGYDGDGGPAVEAHLNIPFGVHYADGRLYIADTGNSVIRAVLLP